MERVVYPIGERRRFRYRRTSFDLNSSGNLLAWHRTQRAFERLGKSFKAVSSRTARELEKGLSRAIKRQNRPPGDWALNDAADRLLEDALCKFGKRQEVEDGFAEFVANEERRYRDGAAGREPKDARKLAVLLNGDETVEHGLERLKRTEERAARLRAKLAAAQKKVVAARNNVDRLETEIRPLRHLARVVAEFFELLKANLPKLPAEVAKLLEQIGEILSRIYRPTAQKREEQEPRPSPKSQSDPDDQPLQM